ncbi:MBL fold metallo-hydrolase [Maledivibacter halophilus]|uniref:L-ascorbate 6-phosphate lactonase n=1 Tax=Maledivibacter halophilus TaxID=36842 RepID=A0A1T5IAI3_9FIRM|nr:MBL fold metallo-hydrolase [Maledivibacter halophilus]SKC36177.1 L-ascorbate 6-phosphate lactonase [Maledivibacter halophilus]
MTHRERHDTMNLQLKIISEKVKENEIALFWLGQAGFVIKNSDDKIIALDPYLTDCGERIKGFKRLSPKLILPSELQPDIYITTHIHFDHFDFDAIPIVASCPKTKFYGPKSCVDKYIEIGIDKDRITELQLGEEINFNNMMIKPVYADHGSLAPDAVGILMNISGVKLYFSGDTAYHPEKMDDVVKFQPDIAVLSVNGKFGNLNSTEGAKLANIVKTKVAIPCHFWTFREHGGDPLLFEKEMEKYASKSKVKFMTQGEMFKYAK